MTFSKMCNMNCRGLLLLAVLLAGLSTVGAGQESTFTSVDVPTIDQLLQQHHIALTKESLLGALQSQDSEVRWLAAQKLADERATDAIPQIVEALRNEKAFRSELNMANALAQLGEQAGLSSLKTICGNRNDPYWGRFLAVEYMLNQGDESCLADILDMIQSESLDSSDEIKALSLLPRFHGVSTAGADQIVSVAVKALTSPDDGVRIEATDTLAGIGNKSAFTPLQAAMNREQNQIVAENMARALKTLAKEQ
jgi:HEAT repeat protein